MTTGKVHLIAGNNRTYCFIKDEAGTLVFAHVSKFTDPEMMLVGANVKFRLSLEPKGKRPEAELVEAA